jgi:hypothetical protein
MMIGTYVDGIQIPEKHTNQQWQIWHTNIQVINKVKTNWLLGTKTVA